MNQKEVAELRRRFKPDKSAISRIYGCYVNSGKEVVSYIDESLGMLPEEEAEKYLGLLKKALLTLYSPQTKWWTATNTGCSWRFGTPG